MPSSAPEKFGPVPTFEWIDIKRLTIDKSYQRLTAGKASQRTIKKIADTFYWCNFQPITVAPRGQKFAVVDGQHRLMAAIETRAIKEVPCWIIPAKAYEDEAAAFVAINRDRVRMDSLSVFHAGVVAGNASDVAIHELCSKAGVSIARCATLMELMPPRTTQALGTLRKACRKNVKDAVLVRALKALADAFPDTPGQMRAAMLRALFHLYASNIGNGKKINDKRMTEVISNNDPETLEDRARANKAAYRNSPWLGIAAELTAQYNNKLPPAERLETLK